MSGSRNPFSGMFGKKKKSKNVNTGLSASGFSASASVSVEYNSFEQPDSTVQNPFAQQGSAVSNPFEPNPKAELPEITFSDAPPAYQLAASPGSSVVPASSYPADVKHNPFASPEDRSLGAGSSSSVRPLSRSTTSSTVRSEDLNAVCGDATGIIPLDTFKASEDEICLRMKGKTDLFTLGSCTTVAIVENSDFVAKYGLRAPQVALVGSLLSVVGAYNPAGAVMFCDNFTNDNQDDKATGIMRGGWNGLTGFRKIMNAFQFFPGANGVNDYAGVGSEVTQHYCQQLKNIKTRQDRGEAVKFPPTLNLITVLVSSPTSWDEILDNVKYAAGVQDEVGIRTRNRQCGFQYILIADKVFVHQYLKKTQPSHAESMYKIYCKMIDATIEAFTHLDDNIMDELKGRDIVDFKVIYDVRNLKGISPDHVIALVMGAISRTADKSTVQK